MADPENQAAHADLLAVVEGHDLPYPLLAINGQVRGAGSAHFYHLLPLVEEALALEGAEQEG